LCRERDENGGAIFCEFAGEQNREPVARQNFWKKILAEAESRPPSHAKFATLIAWQARYIFYVSIFLHRHIHILRESRDERREFCATISLSIYMYFVYLLECVKDNSWYIGYTSDLKKRIKDHQNGYGSRTTSLKTGWKLIYYECYLSKQDALGREKFLKGGSGRTYLKKQLKNYLSGN